MGKNISTLAADLQYIVLGNRGKTRVFRLTFQLHSSSADCARELFKPSKDSASLWVCNEK